MTTTSYVPIRKSLEATPDILSAIRDTRKWIIMDAYVNGNKATLTIINDYGSDDLKATLTYNSDKSFTLERIDGSPIRIVVNNAWVKLPKNWFSIWPKSNNGHLQN